jgi:L-rhamnose mutarotase
VERLCHSLRIVPGTEEEYVRRHREIWPELIQAMREAGFSNYSLFRGVTDVVAYCECSPDIETCFNLFAEAGIADRWQEYMRASSSTLSAPMATLSASLRTGISTER